MTERTDTLRAGLAAVGASTILVGDVRERLRELPERSVQCVVTSPPYYQLRDYGVAGQIGLEQTPAAFIETLVGVFREVRRVLRDDGVVFCNLGDSYAGSGKGPSKSHNAPTGGANPHSMGLNAGVIPCGMRAKSLMLIPERFAIAMADDGWIVRSQIVWAKKSCMPESVKDRPTSAWEPIFMFTKQGKYFWDSEAVRQPSVSEAQDEHNQRYAKVYDATTQKAGSKQPGNVNSIGIHSRPGPGGANLRNVWLLGPEPTREEHYAAYPTEIPKRCILAATSEKGQCPACGSPWRRVVERTFAESGRKPGASEYSRRDPGFARGGAFTGAGAETLSWEPGCSCDAGEPVSQTVLDPFLGSGTTLLVASRLGRRGVGIELNQKYAEIARRRITNDAPLFADVEVAS